MFKRVVLNQFGDDKWVIKTGVFFCEYLDLESDFYWYEYDHAKKYATRFDTKEEAIAAWKRIYEKPKIKEVHWFW